LNIVQKAWLNGKDKLTSTSILFKIHPHRGPVWISAQLCVPDLCEAERKIAAQLSGEEQRKRADFVIENNGFWAEMLINPTELWLNG
jgi:hypothetical protein